MKRIGFADLPLHDGKAPPWLVERMIKLAREIVTIIVDEYGREIFLQRVSDPYWFQAFGCILGYDWHSSGVTTVLTGVLKAALRERDLGIAVCGGKGKASRKTPSEIVEAGEAFNLSTKKIESLQYASKMSAKVDNAAIQAGYSLYHHAFFLTEKGNWAVIQQGMNVNDRTARRYHWLSDQMESFVVEPHKAIVGDVKRPIALDMTAKESESCRKTSVDVSKERPERVARMLKAIRPACQKSLQEWIPDMSAKECKDYIVEFLKMPFTVDWKALKRAYEIQPRNYEELLNIRGIGPSTVRGLALIAEIIYGDKPSWRDPVKYSFAYGGKDGVPYPVNIRSMDESIRILKEAVERAELGDRERLNMLQKLRRFVPPNAEI
ncbi:MAG: DUF763 domain-containing protein [Candidatus Bathyarchaeota archaeon]|nr:DUF763 domain-containing protein [Candidatus Bathyarchaeota archaeon]